MLQPVWVVRGGHSSLQRQQTSRVQQWEQRVRGTAIASALATSALAAPAPSAARWLSSNMPCEQLRLCRHGRLLVSVLGSHFC